MTSRHLAIVGPTASGKSAVALALARRCPDVEIVSVDSMQVYRGMDIGTAKPTAAERAEVPHHLLDLVDPDEEFSLARFQAAARAVVAGIEARGRRALLVGGTGLYVRAVIDELDLPGRYPDARASVEADADTERLHRRLADLDPGAAARMQPTNRRRVVRALEVTLGSGRPFSSFGPGLAVYPPSPFTQIGLRAAPPVLDRRITGRFASMLDAGLVAEVEALAVRRPPLSATAGQALGYRELLAHLAGRCSLDEAAGETVRRTRRFARRQLRWFRRDPRITWCRVDEEPGEDLPAPAAELLGSWWACT
ncbi:MAG: tRNA (adenosine(37)-N6)-dimethylallyltransferase MiaA [Actinomycetota bacterium]|nr:tRNA (adenosine(37)-N6)-dimethylallyltransferase MiaA [Actinomycetota bacterium]